MASHKVPNAMSSFWRDFNHSKLLRDFTLTHQKPYIKGDDVQEFFCEGDFNQRKLLFVCLFCPQYHKSSFLERFLSIETICDCTLTNQ
eukprot:Pgem_evm1s10261